MTEDHRLSGAPVLVVDLRTVFGCDGHSIVLAIRVPTFPEDELAAIIKDAAID
jgi:hypothetical protein